jgi:peroxiredoxin
MGPLLMSDFDDVRCMDAPLADRLEAYAARLMTARPIIADAYSSLVERLVNAGAGSEALGVGDTMPSFSLPDSKGRIRRLEEFIADGPLVVSFNRGHWCSFCRLELLALNEIVPELQSRGASLLSIMPETAVLTRRLIDDYDLAFPILTDIDNGLALRANLMISLGAAIRDLLQGLGTDLAQFQGNSAWFVPIPATYVVDEGYRIIAGQAEPDFRRRMAPSAILDALDGRSSPDSAAPSPLRG